ncbi:MAG: hypothetical protein KatS3mg014_0661 [Actinomycetota bacterium]|nr:MAG: hypothetical protein KatS3mg014_0661 [Actinomycetota bacterium]
MRTTVQPRGSAVCFSQPAGVYVWVVVRSPPGTTTVTVAGSPAFV